jgi:hypothetical protein
MTTNPETPTTVDPDAVWPLGSAEWTLYAGYAEFSLRSTLWPALIEHMRALDRPLTVWSAGSMFGTETYTLAMCLREEGLADRVRIRACDAVQQNTNFAIRGEFLAREVAVDVAMGRLSAEQAHRYFRPVPGYPDVVRLSDKVRELVEFTAPVYVPDHVEAADVIMLRNIWWHITVPERLELVRKLRAALPRDGLVVFRTAYWNEVHQVMPRRGHKQLYGRPRELRETDGSGWKRRERHDRSLLVRHRGGSFG